MRYTIKIGLCLWFSSLLLLTGCMEMAQSPDATTNSAQNDLSSNAAVARRFQDPAADGPTPVESAIELSKKYAALSEQASQLKVENQELTKENNQLKQQVAALGAEADQAQKELAEANDLLIEMRVELNNWKTDVLGFRDEMRQADKVQLEALLKILKVLGGEPTAESDSNSQP